MANQQLHAEAVFQPFDGRGDRRLGDVQLARGLGDAAALDGGDEVFQLTQIVGSHSEPRGENGSGILAICAPPLSARVAICCG
ncbi:hypothetical protein D9M71_784030 [compost metagenome]